MAFVSSTPGSPAPHGIGRLVPVGFGSSPSGFAGPGADGIGLTLHITRLEEAVRQLTADVQALTIRSSTMQNDQTGLMQQVNQLSGGYIPPLMPQSQLPLLPVITSGDTTLYARRIGFANFSQVDTAYRRNIMQFTGRMKAVMYDALSPGRWSDGGVLQRMKEFFSSNGITVDFLNPEGDQTATIATQTQDDLVTRADTVLRHLRAHSYLHEHTILFWTLLEICRQYGIYW